MLGKDEFPYLQAGQEENRIDFSAFVNTCKQRLENELRGTLDLPGPNHFLEDATPLDYERNMEYAINSCAQRLFRNAIGAVRSPKSTLPPVYGIYTYGTREYFEVEAARSLGFHSGYPDVIQAACQLAQTGYDNGWPFVAALTGYPMFVPFHFFPEGTDFKQPIEVASKVPYMSITNYSDKTRGIINPLESEWHVRINYQKLFQKMTEKAQPISEHALDPEAQDDIANAIFGYAGLAATMGNIGGEFMTEPWRIQAAMVLLPYRNNLRLIQELTAKAHRMDKKIDHASFVKRVTRSIESRDTAGVTEKEISGLTKMIPILANLLPANYISLEGLNRAELYLAVHIVPYIHDATFMEQLTQRLSASAIS